MTQKPQKPQKTKITNKVNKMTCLETIEPHDLMEIKAKAMTMLEIGLSGNQIVEIISSYYEGFSLFHLNALGLSNRRESGHLLPIELLFCSEYVKDWNINKALERMAANKELSDEYKCLIKNKGNYGYHLLNRPAVLGKLKNTLQAINIDFESIVNGYKKIAFFNPKNMFHEDGTPKQINEIDDDTAFAIAGLKVSEIFGKVDGQHTVIGHVKEYKLADKIKSLDSLAKIFKLFEEKHNLLLLQVNANGGNVNIHSGPLPSDPAAAAQAYLGLMNGIKKET